MTVGSELACLPDVVPNAEPSPDGTLPLVLDFKAIPFTHLTTIFAAMIEMAGKFSCVVQCELYSGVKCYCSMGDDPQKLLRAYFVSRTRWTTDKFNAYDAECSELTNDQLGVSDLVIGKATYDLEQALDDRQFSELH